MMVGEADSNPVTKVPNAATLTVRGLTKEFRSDHHVERVFEDLDFTIEPRSFVSLIGKSGSGKSTLLKIISGVIEATAGTVSFELPDEVGGEAKIGHVFQEPRLLPWESCVENIEYVHADDPNYTDDLAKEYLDLVELSAHYDKYPTQLSGGQRQRVGIARAFSIQPQVLLMDEPFSNLDEITAEALRSTLMDIWREHQTTIFFVTHDITEAIELSDRILMLGRGRIYNDIEVDLDRPREVDSAEFLTFRQEAIRKFHSIDEE